MSNRPRPVANREAIAPATYADAPTLYANGYCPIPCTYGQTSPHGPWNVHRASFDSTNTGGVAVVCAIRPCGSFSVADAAYTYVSGLELDIYDPKLAKIVDALVVSRLKWSEETPLMERRSPVRTHPDSSATLRIFRMMDESFPYHGTETTGRYLLTKEKTSWSFSGHSAAIFCTGRCIVVSGAPAEDARAYEWTGGDLLTVRRTQLPIMTRDDAAALIEEIDGLMESKCTRV